MSGFDPREQQTLAGFLLFTSFKTACAHLSPRRPRATPAAMQVPKCDCTVTLLHRACNCANLLIALTRQCHSRHCRLPLSRSASSCTLPRRFHLAFRARALAVRAIAAARDGTAPAGRKCRPAPRYPDLLTHSPVFPFWGPIFALGRALPASLDRLQRPLVTSSRNDQQGVSSSGHAF